MAADKADADRFSYRKLSKGFSAIGDVFKAYGALRCEVASERQLDEAACDIIRAICDENISLKRGVPDCDGDDGVLELGRFSQKVDKHSLNLVNTLRNECPHFDGSLLSATVAIDRSKPCFILLSQRSLKEMTKKLVRRAFCSTLRMYPDAQFAFADLEDYGSSFSFAQGFISAFPARSGGRVLMVERDVMQLIEDLRDKSAETISLLGDSYETAAEYNASNWKKIPRCFVAIILGEKGYQAESIMREIASLARNRVMNNIDLVVIGQTESLDVLSDLSDLYIREESEELFADQCGGVRFEIQLHDSLDEINADSLIDEMKRRDQIDARFEINESIFPDLLSMDAGEVLRIPFALDEDGKLQYFEIGGSAAAHALISGKTGSGKSVALHTLIMQIICNYHPDDVEIWAIDYKAVEFDWYIQHRAPHFKVIARDDSDEFTYSLLDLIDEEYRERQRKFLKAGVNSIDQYRQKMGTRSMPRIVIFVDEFQVMTQAVQAYTGAKDYRKTLENHLRLTRAMGISFVFCSQTVASGLGGLTDAARDQIASRLCLQQQSAGEIRETLAINGPDEDGVIKRVENLRKGQSIYKRVRRQEEYAFDGKAYEMKLANIVYMSQGQRAEAIEKVCRVLGDGYARKDLIVACGEARTSLRAKYRHPVMALLTGRNRACGDCVEWYPAAPASLSDSFCIKLEDVAGSNVLIVGENDELRESIVTHSVIGLLADPRNKVIATFVNESHPDRKRMIEQLKRIQSKRLKLAVGTQAALEVISNLSRIRPEHQTRTIYIWYGLDKLKNELFLVGQDKKESSDAASMRIDEGDGPQNVLDDLTNFLDALTNAKERLSSSAGDIREEEMDFSECRTILRQAFEYGPENNQYHVVIFNSRKGLKNSGLVDLSDFDNRIATRMSSEDAFDLFGSSRVMDKANDSTVVCFSSAGRDFPLRPYLMPNDEDYLFYNRTIGGIDDTACV